MRHFLLVPANSLNDCLEHGERQSSNTKANDSLCNVDICACGTDVVEYRTQTIPRAHREVKDRVGQAAC